jgi:hypothetical protein
MDTNFIVKLYQNNKLLLTIIILLVIYLYIYSKLIYKYLYKYININSQKFRDNPILGKKSISDNIYSYFIKNIENGISIFLKPFIYVIDLIIVLIKDIGITLNKFRNMAQITRNLFKYTVENTINRISNTYASITYLQEKLKLIIRKQSALFAIIKQFGDSAKFIIYSFTNGPIPKGVKFFQYYGTIMLVYIVTCLICIFNPFPLGIVACPACMICFDKSTPIQIDSKIYKNIENIKLNETIFNGGQIKGLIKVLAGQTKMYKYNGVIVSGSHLVYENSKWIRVENSKLAISIKYNNNNVLYCLINKNNKILSNGILFSDYQETNNNIINNLINNYTINYLNNTNKTNTNKTNQYYWGFSKSTDINTNNGLKNIKNIKIGDYILNSKVIGLVKLDGGDIELFNYKGLIISGQQIVNENGIWLRIYQSKISRKVEKEKYIYHLITNDNIISINNLKFRDFCETNDNIINNRIDILVEKFKNIEVYSKNVS